MADTSVRAWWTTAAAAAAATAIFAAGCAAGWTYGRRTERARRVRQDEAYRALSAALGALRGQSARQAEDLAEARARLASLTSALEQSSIEHPSNISLGIESFALHDEGEGSEDAADAEDQEEGDEEYDEDGFEDDTEEDSDAGVDLSAFRTPAKRRVPRNAKAASPVRSSSSGPLFDTTNMSS